MYEIKLNFYIKYEKVTDPKHVPKEFKDQFLKKLSFCATPLDFNDDSKQYKEKVFI